MVTFTGWVGLGTVFNSRGTMQSERDSRLGLHILFVVVHSLSHVRCFAIPWTAAHQASLSNTNSWSSLKLISNHLILCHPLLLLPSTFPASGSLPMSQLFAQVAKVLDIQLQHKSSQYFCCLDAQIRQN